MEPFDELIAESENNDGAGHYGNEAEVCSSGDVFERACIFSL